MNIATLKAWATQPTTIHAFGAVALGTVTAAAHFAGASTELAGALGIASYALVHAGINDSSASRSIDKIIEDAATAYVAGRLSATLPLLVADGSAALTAFMAPPAAAPVAPVAAADPAAAPIAPAV